MYGVEKNHLFKRQIKNVPLNYFQFDPPDDPKEYIHRVGRTARGEGGKGHALLILRPEELGFLRYLRQANVPLNEFEFSWSKVSDIQPQVTDFTS